MLEYISNVETRNRGLLIQVESELRKYNDVVSTLSLQKVSCEKAERDLKIAKKIIEESVQEESTGAGNEQQSN